MTEFNLGNGNTQPSVAELIERLGKVRLSPAEMLEKSAEFFGEFKLPYDHKLEIEPYLTKDKFGTDDKNSPHTFVVLTPAEGNKDRMFYKHTPDWAQDTEALAPRDFLHSLLGTVLVQARRAYRNKGTLLTAQNAEGRSNKRPATEALIAITLDKFLHITHDNEVYDQAKSAIRDFFGDEGLPEDREELIESIIGKAVELVGRVA